MTSWRPSGRTRVRVWRRISTSTTEPSCIAIGPSGNFSPSVTTSNSMPDPFACLYLELVIGLDAQAMVKRLAAANPAIAPTGEWRQLEALAGGFGAGGNQKRRA